tara:strand:- start:97 stop:627 length:531 start_codon:yes stop_codon:yes gene_type:complete
MDSTKSYIKIYNISPETAQDFDFDYDTAGIAEGRSDILTELVPDLDNWDNLGWMEAEEYEYSPSSGVMEFTLETKWTAPVEWLRHVSYNIHFQNKLITMTTIQKDETAVQGVAVMDGEVLQNKYIFEMDSEDVGKYYNDDEKDYDLDDLDTEIWDSIDKFVKVCEQFYLEKEEQND